MLGNINILRTQPGLRAVRVTIFSTGGKFRPVSILFLCALALYLCVKWVGQLLLNEWGSYGKVCQCFMGGDMLKQKLKPVVMQCMGKGTSLRPHNEHWRASSLSATQEYILRIVYLISAGFFSLGLLQRSLQQKAEEALMVKSASTA